MNPLHDYFEPIVQKQRVKSRVGAVVWLILAGVGAAWGFWSDVSGSQTAHMATLALVSLPLPLGLLVWSFRPHRGLAALGDPSRIVWHYGVLKGGQVHAVMIGFEDGKLFRFALPLISIKEGFSQEALQLFRASAPKATTGFTEDRRKAFVANPGSLKR